MGSHGDKLQTGRNATCTQSFQDCDGQNKPQEGSPEMCGLTMLQNMDVAGKKGSDISTAVPEQPSIPCTCKLCAADPKYKQLHPTS